MATDNDQTTAQPDNRIAKQILGYTQRQSVSELQAGGRAIVSPSDLTQALSSAKGRTAARAYLNFGFGDAVKRYIAFRPHAMKLVLERALSANDGRATIVDVAGGFSPQMIWLAQDYPGVQCVEIDLPGNSREKRRRLRNFELPANLEFIEADLGATSLDEVLDGRLADIMIFIAAYASPSRFPHAM